MVKTALHIHVKVQHTALLKSQLAFGHTKYLKVGSYLDILVFAAVNVATRAALTECASRNVAEGDEASATIFGANHALTTFAHFAAFRFGVGVPGKDSSDESESNKNELHVDEVVSEKVFLSNKI